MQRYTFFRRDDAENNSMKSGQQRGGFMRDSITFGPNTTWYEKHPKKDQQRTYRAQQRRALRRDQPPVYYCHLIGFYNISLL